LGAKGGPTGAFSKIQKIENGTQIQFLLNIGTGPSENDHREVFFDILQQKRNIFEGNMCGSTTSKICQNNVRVISFMGNYENESQNDANIKFTSSTFTPK
jgi:hypothetical protein